MIAVARVAHEVAGVEVEGSLVVEGCVEGGEAGEEAEEAGVEEEGVGEKGESDSHKHFASDSDTRFSAESSRDNVMPYTNSSSPSNISFIFLYFIQAVGFILHKISCGLD